MTSADLTRGSRGYARRCAPHLGVNALYAAQIGLAAIKALHETFRDEDTIQRGLARREVYAG